MSTSFTYATLKTAIKNHVEDQGTDFDGNVDTIIQLGEDQILRDLPLEIFDAKAQSVAITAGTQTATKPTGTVAMRSLYYTSGGTRYFLAPRSKTWMDAVCTDTTQRAPRWFDEGYSATQIYIAPNPNLSVTALADITKRPTSIVSASPTFLGTNVGDLLLASCLIKAQQFNLGWEEGANWNAVYKERLASARIDLRHLLRRDYATLAPQPAAAGKGER